MTRFFSVLAFLLISFFVYGFYVSQFELNFVPRTVKTSDLYYDYRLSMNIHTNQSIGSEPLSVILGESKKAENNFILISDLNPSMKIPDDSYFQNIGVLQGAKYGYKDSRLLYFSTLDKNLGLRAGESQLQLSDLLTGDAVKNENHFISLAHPFSLGFDWTGDIPIGLDGIEIVNLKSLSQHSWRKSKLSTLWSLLIYPFNPKLALIRLFQEPTEEISLFDQVSSKRPFVATAGAEASARAIPLTDWLIKFPSYERSLSIVSNHLLLTSELSGNMQVDRESILTALKRGQFYICFDALGEPKGFQTYLLNEQSRKRFPLGSNIQFDKNLKIYFKLPSEPTAYYEVVLYRNGERIDVLNTFEGLFSLPGPGAYRLQVRISPRLPLPDAVKWLSWIYTNNYYIN
ncbi:MAG: hypothetical protein A2622_04840 [Bdellovibrionales bacterium RIFCSPHIGHO2_01_FULL_40_29]|nr:MAG: hypothetical protein A2622_04840 [Bdellovibrionales bacterium RIFCSPHIGHO2_01_FULL_40_29]OFZ34740.1 MAG: hypothetical protein A3D17_10530 [Bdellovibrionales bacterium RIFCSPHIGHO2_02_FULL_40_15]